jgi:NTP pyrophosphatase (non-canonical NTP hydrolase)
MADHCRYPADRLIDIMMRLRGADGCPWDLKQTSSSLKPYVIEEAYEVVEAIDGGDPGKLCEELGDLLLQIAFHCQIASEQAAFNFNDRGSAGISRGHNRGRSEARLLRSSWSMGDRNGWSSTSQPAAVQPGSRR